jgi:Uma2 family endonuclease
MGLSKRKYQLPPRTGMEVFMMLPEGTLAELINDTIFMSPAPNYYHQSISLNLAAQINIHIQKNNLGECVTAPMDVFFDNKNVLQPDIILIAADNLSIVQNGKIKGTPDLIIEIVSPGNKKHDTETKKSIYEKFGATEYFIVDPETKDTITWYLADKKYTKQPSVKGKIKSKLLKKTFAF